MRTKQGSVANDGGDVEDEGEEGNSEDDDKFATGVVTAEPESIGRVFDAWSTAD